MLIAVDEKLLKNITEALLATQRLIAESRESRLLTELEAQVYLGRDQETLRYYRTLGLESYKKGKDRWYLKADIDAWLESGKVNRHKR